MAAEKRTPEDLLWLTDHFAVVSTGTVQNWARSARRQAQMLRGRAAANRERAAALQQDVPVDPPNMARLLRERLEAAERRARNLEQAQRSNRRIGMAIGILMARHGLTEEQAFAALRTASSRRNIRLASIAEEVIYTGMLTSEKKRRP